MINTFEKRNFNATWVERYAEKVRNLFGSVETCTHNGLSLYTTYKGYKVRFSDHEPGIGKRETYICLALSQINLEVVEDEIMRRDINNYKEVTYQFETKNTIYGIGKMHPKSHIISSELVGKTKKGDDLFLFTVEKTKLVYKFEK